MREFERSGRDAAIVVWDGALSAGGGRGAGGTTEEELTLVASLLCALDGGGTPVHVLTLGGEGDEPIPANGADGSLATDALKALALTLPARTVPLLLALDRASAGEYGALGQLFFVSSSPGADLVECVAACVARGEAPVVAWFEFIPAPKRSRGGDGERGRTGVGAAPSPRQEDALLATGARLVRVSLREGQPAQPVLERALLELLEAI